MTTFFDTLTSIVEDLSRDLPADKRYRRLLDAMLKIFPCDAAALLKLENNTLSPLAIDGLSQDTMGRRFAVEEHPRLARLLHSRQPVRFAADSDLPDPYDGLVETEDHLLHVHDCMGFSLYMDDTPWGVLTLDAMQPGTFDEMDPIELRTFISLTEATVKAAHRMDELAAKAKHQQLVAQTLISEGSSREIIGRSASMKRLKEELSIAAQSHLTVLVLGETGVGKELVARSVHRQSSRAKQPMVYINCAALPDNIAESELFGHVKGAFSGAIADRAGKFEIADGGTLFLDEVGELSLAIQAKMLRALQNGEIQRVGSDRHIQVDVRIVAATNRDLHKEVLQHRFRADLYHRLSVYPIQVPPLRERGRDVILLAGYLLESNQRRLGVQGLRLADDARQSLLSYNWPGNVRELEHLLSRAALKAIASQDRNARTITIKSVHLNIESDQDPKPLSTAEIEIQSALSRTTKPIRLKAAIDQFQSRLIRQTLQQHDNNQAAAARELGINRSNFYRLLNRLNLSEE
ncbi:nitric oxide reductase transcriptional regulator NorR [Motiliproteus sp. MSK22-1]|uniref:nitric oxide reductase transcriptional regulator NorR n=1 Tax=Motiliproteus sp. MSK22-1 TaxID=1897630 RepID=UPI0009780E50|nr:nitric oxide reductase transcriptional regulator NorR [Motiliproteus sp. MSK22-1]OMH29464.1 nitric oxide reductase transcription regulator [Motiliproteus sp. MSK22-1]